MVSWGQASALNNAPQTPNNCKPKPVPCPPPRPKPVPCPQPAPAPAPAKPELSPGQTDIHYPETDNKEVNAAIKAHIDGLVENFKNRAFEAGNGDTKGAHYELTYDSGFIGDNLISFRFTAVETLKEGAAPVKSVFTFLYDLSSGKLVEISDVFARRNYSKALSRLVFEGLKDSEPFKSNEAELALLKKGTEAKPENFENIFIKDGKLYLLFSPGQISSSGEIKEFVVDMKDHADLFSKEFQVQ